MPCGQHYATGLRGGAGLRAIFSRQDTKQARSSCVGAPGANEPALCRTRAPEGSDNMSYVERVLQPGEQVRHISSIHWIVYWPSVVVALLAVAAYWFGEMRLLPSVWLYTACALALGALALVVREWYQWWITEIAVTNRRVIYKKGLVRLKTNEMNMDKVESVQVDQSVLGRMFDFGTVKILGTGEGLETLHTIASPIKLRNSIITVA
jgi:membrane protein YdbS with pleckstrin-like domain